MLVAGRAAIIVGTLPSEDCAGLFTMRQQKLHQVINYVSESRRREMWAALMEDAQIPKKLSVRLWHCVTGFLAYNHVECPESVLGWDATHFEGVGKLSKFSKSTPCIDHR